MSGGGGAWEAGRGRLFEAADGGVGRHCFPWRPFPATRTSSLNSGAFLILLNTRTPTRPQDLCSLNERRWWGVGPCSARAS